MEDDHHHIKQQIVKLQFSCKNLKDICSKENPCPQIRIECREPDSTIDDRTEIIANQQNPEFKKAIPINFIFEITQTLEISVFDTSNPDPDAIDWIKITLADIIGSVHQTLTIKLLSRNINSRAEMIIHAFRPKNSHMYASIQLEGSHLTKPKTKCLSLFAKANPYLAFSSKNEFTEQFEEKHRTNVIKNSTNPKWMGFKIPLSVLCNGSKDAPIKIDYYSEGTKGSQLLGTVSTTFDKIEKKQRHVLIDENKARIAGFLKPMFAATSNDFEVVDYLFSGEQLNLFVAVDLTSSNKDPSDPNSLHYRTSVKKSIYEEVFTEVCDSILKFNYEKKIHAIGFGAQPKYPKLQTKSVQHYFPLSGDEFEVRHIEGLLAAYNIALKNVSLQGPPWIHQIIQNVGKEIANYGSNMYNVLVIITDGEIYDKNQTVSAMVDLCDLPLSMIIIGVGNEKFDQLKILNDEQDIVEDAYKKKKLTRPFLKFIHYDDKEYKRNIKLLNKDVMTAIGEQFIDYKMMKNLLPTVS